MANTKTKPGTIPNIHPSCQVQVIDDTGTTPRWKTIATCFDAPNPIAEVLKRNGLKSAWVRDCLGDRRYVTL